LLAEDARINCGVVGQSGNQSSTQASHISRLHALTPTHAHRMSHVRRRRQPRVSLTWITVLSYLFIKISHLGLILSRPSYRSLARSPSLLVDTVTYSCSRLERPPLVSNTRLSPVSYSYLPKQTLSMLPTNIAAFQVYKAIYQHT